MLTNCIFLMLFGEQSVSLLGYGVCSSRITNCDRGCQTLFLCRRVLGRVWGKIAYWSGTQPPPHVSQADGFPGYVSNQISEVEWKQGMFCLRLWRQRRAGVDAHTLVMHPSWPPSRRNWGLHLLPVRLLSLQYISLHRRGEETNVTQAGEGW